MSSLRLASPDLDDRSEAIVRIRRALIVLAVPRGWSGQARLGVTGCAPGVCVCRPRLGELAGSGRNRFGKPILDEAKGR